MKCTNCITYTSAEPTFYSLNLYSFSDMILITATIITGSPNHNLVDVWSIIIAVKFCLQTRLGKSPVISMVWFTVHPQNFSNF